MKIKYGLVEEGEAKKGNKVTYRYGGKSQITKGTTYINLLLHSFY